MNVLVLGPHMDRISDVFLGTGDAPRAFDGPIDVDFLAARRVDFVVSYGYRHIIRPPVIEALPGRIINLHISYLPYNRGAHPNFWSFVENTPAGVTIHHVDAGVDTGDIIAREKVALDPEHETFRTSYDKLMEAVEGLLQRTWPAIRDQKATPAPQAGPGSVHKKKDIEPLWPLLEQGWDTPVAAFLKRLNESGRRAAP